MDLQTEKKVLSVKEAAAYIGASEGAVYKAIREHQIPALRLGKRAFIHRDEIDARLHGKVA